MKIGSMLSLQKLANVGRKMIFHKQKEIRYKFKTTFVEGQSSDVNRTFNLGL